MYMYSKYFIFSLLCDAVKSVVYTVLSKAVDLLKKERNVSKSSQSCLLKVCGKDEFLEE